MAEIEHDVVSVSDGAGGVCKIVAICENTQTSPIPETGEPSPLVVRIRLVNTTAHAGVGRWLHSNGDVVTGAVLSGESQEININPPRRMPLYQISLGISWSRL